MKPLKFEPLLKSTIWGGNKIIAFKHLAIKQYEKEHGVRGIDAMRPFLNPDSLRINTEARIEEFAATLPEYSYLQFQRIGYYNVDPDSTPEKPVFNKTVGLKQ